MKKLFFNLQSVLSQQSVFSPQSGSPQSSVHSKSIPKHSEKHSEKKTVAKAAPSSTKAKSNDGGYIWIV